MHSVLGLVRFSYVPDLPSRQQAIRVLRVKEPPTLEISLEIMLGIH
jgi:hypothetical protein